MRGSTGGDASTRWASRTFVAVVLVALPTLVFVLGHHRWFHGDDWSFIFGRSAHSANDLFRPSNSHWSTVPILWFRLLYATVGLRAYWPYQLVVVTMHLAACCIVRGLMRRSGVHPWIATAAATALVFFGAGYANVIWAFQIGFSGALAYGLGQLLLADHDGPLGKRDYIALGVGALALMSAGVGVITVATVGLAMLLSRGWKVALFHTVPLAAFYLVWASITHPDTSGPLGYPPLRVMWRWLLRGETGLFLALGGSLLVAWILFAFTAVGTTWAWRTTDRAGTALRAAIPTAMLVGNLLFTLTACAGRWNLGIGTSRSSRFLHIMAAFTMPAIALGATVITTQLARLGPVGKIAVPAACVILLLGVPPGLDDYRAPPFNAGYYRAQKRVLLNITRVPEAQLAPPHLRPIPDPFRARYEEIGYLRDAARSGKLPESTKPLTNKMRQEFRVRLGVLQDPNSLPKAGAEPCPTVQGPVRLAPAVKGTKLRITSPVVIRTVKGGRPLFKGVGFRPQAGTDLQIVLSGLDLEIRPQGFTRSMQLCQGG
ncbi:MAG: hypothetical protein JO291_13125 [Acidimicrobiia bacterium]|nr:hypothetical protein [Acidimicrobiia bacterium]